MRGLPSNPKVKNLVGATCCASMMAVTALACNSASAAQVYNKDGVSLDVFGSVQAAFVDRDLYRDLSDGTSDTNTLHVSGELGIAGRSKIADGLDGIMMAMWEASADGQSNSGDLGPARYMYVGFDAYQYGSLIVGRGDGAYYTVAGATDIFNVVEGHASDYYLLAEQRPASFMYSLRALSWDLKLSYMMVSKERYGDTPLTARKGMGASLSTKFGDKVTFAYGIDYTDFNYLGDPTESEKFFANMLTADGLSYQDALKKAKEQHVGSKTEYGASLSYGILGQGLYAALYAGATKYDYMNHHIYTVDTALSYAFANGFSLSAGYGLKHYDGIAIVSELGLGLAYKFSPACTIFAEGQFDLDGEAQKFYGQDMKEILGLNENKFAIGAEIYF